MAVLCVFLCVFLSVCASAVKFADHMRYLC